MARTPGSRRDVGPEAALRKIQRRFTLLGYGVLVLGFLVSGWLIDGVPTPLETYEQREAGALTGTPVAPAAGPAALIAAAGGGIFGLSATLCEIFS